MIPLGWTLLHFLWQGTFLSQGTVIPPDNQHGHRITFQAVYLAESNEPMIAIPANTLTALIARLGLDADAVRETVVLRSGPPSAGVYGTASSPLPKFTSPVPSVAVEMWVEDSYSSFVESIATPLPEIERAAGKTTIHPFARDLRRQLIVDFPVAIETLPEAGTYRVSFPEAIPDPSEIPAGFTLVSPKFPVPQILHDGDTVRVELYRNPQSGLTLVDYLHVGALNQMKPRNEAPHDSYASDAEFNLSRAQVRVNGVGQAVGRVPETLRAPIAWIYIPGYGRYVLSFQPNTDGGGESVGEVNGTALTLTEGQNILRIECTERIASGSGAYRVYAVKDAAWVPADPDDRKTVVIGTAPSRGPEIH